MLHLPDKLVEALTNGISFAQYSIYPRTVKFCDGSPDFACNQIPKCETFKELFSSLFKKDLHNLFLKYLYHEYKQSFLVYTNSSDCEVDFFERSRPLDDYDKTVPLDFLTKLFESCIAQEIPAGNYARFIVYCLVAAVRENADNSTINYFLDQLEEVVTANVFLDQNLITIYNMLYRYDFNVFVRFMDVHPLVGNACRSLIYKLIDKADVLEYVILTQPADIFTPFLLSAMLRNHSNNDLFYNHFVNNMPATQYNIVNAIHEIKYGSSAVSKTNIEFLLCTYPQLIDLNELHAYDSFRKHKETKTTFLSEAIINLQLFELFIAYGADLDNEVNVNQIIKKIPYTWSELYGHRYVTINATANLASLFCVKKCIMDNVRNKDIWQEHLTNFIAQLRSWNIKTTIIVEADMKDFFQYFDVAIDTQPK
jgi:hypothetical protein